MLRLSATATAWAVAVLLCLPVVVAWQTQLQGALGEAKPPSEVHNATNATVDSYGNKLLLVAVCTAPSHFDQRDAIRSTWKHLLPANVAKDYDVLFFIGKTSEENSSLEPRLATEALVNKDIVRLDSFVESYENLTRKTLGMIRWAASHNYETMLKADDDTYVLLDNLFYDVVAFDPERSMQWWGKFWGDDSRPVDRQPNSKYFLSSAEYTPDVFPNYPDGPCYLLGKELLKYLDLRAPSLHMFRLEDSAVGIWLNDATNLPYHQTFGGGYMYLRECPEGQYYYFVNPVTSDEMRSIHARYSNREDICSHNYSLAICSTPDKGCLCSPSEHNCWDDQHVL